MKKAIIFLIFFTNINLSFGKEPTFDVDFTYEPIQETYDPLESINRKIYSLNSIIDTYGLKPLAIGYKKYTPKIIQKGVTNFIDYVETPVYAINYGLQGNKHMAGDAMGRFILNTFGFGVLDFASSVNIPKNKTNFGETLGVWGVQEGPYLVLPILGGGSLRDKASQVSIDMNINTYQNFDLPIKQTFIGLKVIDERKRLLQFDDLLHDSQLDEYSFVRSAILNSKRNKILELKESE